MLKTKRSVTLRRNLFFGSGLETKFFDCFFIILSLFMGQKSSTEYVRLVEK